MHLAGDLVTVLAEGAALVAAAIGVALRRGRILPAVDVLHRRRAWREVREHRRMVERVVSTSGVGVLLVHTAPSGERLLLLTTSPDPSNGETARVR